MVKGISRQVIVMQSPDPQLFDQAIFILRDEAVKNGVTDEALMKEAKHLIGSGKFEKRGTRRAHEVVWIGLGAMLTGAAWLITALFGLA